MKTIERFWCLGILSFTALSAFSASASDFEESRFAHANGDRVVLFSTAETHPQGTVFFSDYELFLLQAGYAFSDDVQLSLTTMPPVISGEPLVLDLAAKWNFWRQDRFRAAVVGAPTLVSETGATQKSVLLGRVGAVGQYCFTLDCGTSISSNVGLWFNSSSSFANSAPIVGSIGGVVSLNDMVSLLIEPTYAVSLVGASRRSELNGLMLNYGVRFSGEQWGVDLALIRPFSKGYNDLIIGYPFLGFTYRTQVSRSSSFIHETVAKLTQAR